MKFLIDTKDGKTITADLADCSLPYRYDEINRIDVYTSVRPGTQVDDGCENVPCILSTARSLEAEAVKEVTRLLRGLT